MKVSAADLRAMCRAYNTASAAGKQQDECMATALEALPERNGYREGYDAGYDDGWADAIELEHDDG